ncbi:macrophage mannose receptor 1-like [Ptychodera flava]|uniref:macrophage mannose receptor 1-like n=1 Tax=Ptychodera flava TaxID=63121 RepID=UPI00396A1B21
MQSYLAILTTIVCLFGIGVGQRCPKGWLTHYQRCFLIIDDEGERNYHDAAYRCRDLALGATLAVIETGDLNDYLVAHMVKGTDGHWIGLDDLAVEGKFEWADGKHLDDTQAQWDVGEPNTGGPNDCVQLRRTTGKWSAKSCGLAQKGIVCQAAMTIPVACDEDNGWHSVNDRCMKFFPQPKSWQDAQDYCQTMGANLPKVTGLVVQDYITDRSSSDGTLWLGLSNLKGLPTEYAWIDETTPSFTNWQAGQPISTGGRGCVEVQQGNNGEWSTQSCDSTNAYVCEKAEGKCAPGWMINRGSCYQFNTAIPASWSEAKHMCDAQGGHLVTINNRVENDFLISQFSALTLAHVQDMWIGISDMATDGTFLWSDGTQTVPFTNWNVGQPDQRVDENDCGAVYAAGYLGPKTWRDDGRCGADYLQDDDETPAECHPDSLWPCCSTYGWCGNTDAHCNCARTCIDYAKAYDLGDWNTRPCINNYPFICEINSDQPVVPLSQDTGIGFCDDKWVLHGDSCYFFEGLDLKNFHDASDACRKEGAELTSILTDAEQSFIGGRLRYFNTDPWIGLRSDGSKVAWLDKSRLDFTYWADENPDLTGNDACVQILSDESALGKWDDRECLEQLGYICKKGKQRFPSAEKSCGGVSGGGVAGIVIAMLLVTVGVAALVYLWTSGRFSSLSMSKEQNFSGFANDTYAAKETPVIINDTLDTDANKGL